MSGPDHQAAGAREPSPWTRFPPRLVVGFAALWLVGVGAAVWTHIQVIRNLGEIQQEQAAQATRPGVRELEVRGEVIELKAALLNARLARDPASARAQFQTLADQLGRRILQAKRLDWDAGTAPALTTLDRTFGTFLTHAAGLVAEPPSPLRRDAVEVSEARIREITAPLLQSAEDWDEALATAHESDAKQLAGNLTQLRARQRLATVTLLMLGIAGAGLAYFAARHLGRPLELASTSLARQEKLASLGTLAAGVAHEIRNPLTAIKLRLFSLNQSLPGEWANHEDLQVIDNEISRLERMVKGLLDFARPDWPALSAVCAAALLEEVRRLLEPELQRRKIRVVLEATPPLPVMADRQQLKQVLINLVQNAADSISPEGTVTLRATRGASRLGGRSRPTVLIEVADTGQGIPEEARQRLFDPFFSTKVGGTGLGLAVAARIVENHGGLIQYQTQAQRGTTFQLVLPASEDHVSKDPAH